MGASSALLGSVQGQRPSLFPVLLLSQAGTLVAWIIFTSALFVPRVVLLEWRSAWTGDFTLSLPLLVLFVAFC